MKMANGASEPSVWWQASSLLGTLTGSQGYGGVGRGSCVERSAPTTVAGDRIEKLTAIRSQLTRTDAPMVSICCVTYNHAAFIADALESFLEQVVNFSVEILVHDDLSTDGGRDIVRTYAERYPSVITAFLPDQNQFSKGVNVMRNLRHEARGKYLALCEGDDAWRDPQKLVRQVTFLEENPDYVMTGHRIMQVDPAGHPVGNYPRRHLFSKRDQRERDLSAEALRTLEFIVPTSTRVFRNIPLTVPPESEHILAGDAFLQSQLADYGAYKFMPDILPSHYRVHQAGIWSGTSPEIRLHHTQTLFFWMAMYHERLGNTRAACRLMRRQSLIMMRIILRRLLGRKISCRLSALLRR